MRTITASSHQCVVGHLGAAIHLLPQIRFLGNACPARGVGKLNRLGRQLEHPPALSGARWGLSAHRGRTGLSGYARAPTRAELEGLLDKIIVRLMKMLTRQGYLVEEQGVSYIADIDPDNPLRSLQAASYTYRIAPGRAPDKSC